MKPPAIDRRDDLPALGWIAKNDGEWTAAIGRSVDVVGPAIVEGCWPGAFSEAGFQENPHLFGSGASWAGDEPWFCPPNHTMDALYVLFMDGVAYVSNSLFLIFAESGLTPDPDVHYTRRLFTASHGLDAAREVIHRTGGAVLHRVLCDDFTIRGTDVVRRRKPVADDPLDSYDDYKTAVLRVLKGCQENAADPARRRSYELLSMTSSGYDSSAGAALAKALGGRKTITVGEARGGHSDSGLPVAEDMGLECIERGRLIPGSEGAPSEIEFLISGAGGADYPVAIFDDVLGGTVLLSGHYGDTIWGMKPNISTTYFRAPGNSGASMSEYRLKTDFIHIPVCFIFARRHPEIVAISRSDEMKPWSIGGSYDRPIPRRLIEEAGGRRESFGQIKEAMALVFSWGPSHLSEETREAFHRYLREENRYYVVYARHYSFGAANLGYRAAKKALARVPAVRKPLKPAMDRAGLRLLGYENSAFANQLFIWAMRTALEQWRGQTGRGQG